MMLSKTGTVEDKLCDIEARLRLTQAYVEARTLSKQQHRALFGSIERLQTAEIDCLEVGDDNALRGRRKQTARWCNTLLDRLEKLDSDRLDGAVQFIGGITSRVVFREQTKWIEFGFCIVPSSSSVTIQHAIPSLSLQIADTDLAPASKRLSEYEYNPTSKAFEVDVLKEEVLVLAEKVQKTYTNLGLMGNSCECIVVSLPMLPKCFFLGSRRDAGNQRFRFLHNHDALIRHVCELNSDEVGFDNNAILCVSWDGICLSLTAARRTNVYKEWSVVFASRRCIEYKRRLKSIRKAITQCVRYCELYSTENSYGASMNRHQETGSGALCSWSLYLDLGDLSEMYAFEMMSVFESRGMSTTTNYVRSFKQDIQVYGESIARAHTNISDRKGSSYVKGELARCTIGIMTCARWTGDKNYKLTRAQDLQRDCIDLYGSEAMVGTLMPLIRPSDCIGTTVTEILHLSGDGREDDAGTRGEMPSYLELIVGVQPNGDVTTRTYSVAANLLYTIRVVGLPTELTDVKVELCYRDDRSITVRVAVKCDTSYDIWSWLNGDIVIDGDSSEGYNTAPVGTLLFDSVSCDSKDKDEASRKPATVGWWWSCPSQAKYYKNLGNENLKTGLYDDLVWAHTLYSQAIAMDPWNAVYYSNRSACSLHLASAEKDNYYLHEAYSDAVDCRVLDEQWPKAHIRVGDAQYRLNKFDESVQSYTRALDLDPSCVGTNEKLMTSLQKRETAATKKKEANARNKVNRGMDDGVSQETMDGNKSSSSCACM